MTRDEALALLKQHVRAENLVKHCLATEAIMRSLARRLGEDPEIWGLAGLLHDIDFEQTGDTPERHGLIAAELLAQHDIAPEIIDAVKAHNAEWLDLRRSTPFHHALAAAETITGLVVAAALVQPGRKVASVKVSSIRKRMKKKDFARNVDRGAIMECEQFDMEVDDFIALSLDAMTMVADDLGL